MRFLHLVMGMKLQISYQGQHHMINCWSKPRIRFPGCFYLLLESCCSWWHLWKIGTFKAFLQKGVCFFTLQWQFGGFILRVNSKNLVAVGWGWFLVILFWHFHGCCFLCTVGEKNMIRQNNQLKTRSWVESRFVLESILIVFGDFWRNGHHFVKVLFALVWYVGAHIFLIVISKILGDFKSVIFCFSFHVYKEKSLILFPSYVHLNCKTSNF